MENNIDFFLQNLKQSQTLEEAYKIIDEYYYKNNNLYIRLVNSQSFITYDKNLYIFRTLCGIFIDKKMKDEKMWAVANKKIYFFINLSEEQ